MNPECCVDRCHLIVVREVSIHTAREGKRDWVNIKSSVNVRNASHGLGGESGNELVDISYTLSGQPMREFRQNCME